MTKAIIFDFWGTLVENGVWSPTKQVKNILQIDMPFSEYVVRMERAMMTSHFKELREAFASICKEFGVECPTKKMEMLIGLWNKNWMLAKPYPEVEETLEKLKKNYRLFLVSNSDCFGVKNVMEKFKLTPLFEKVYFSYEQGLIKTDEDFLKRVLEENHLAAEDCILVGDSIQSDMLPAQRLAIKAVLIDRKDSREFELKIKSLKELEGLL